MGRKYGTIDQMARKNDADEWVCRTCGAVIGEGHHAKVLAHYNLNHRQEFSEGSSGSSGSSGNCNHEIVRLKPNMGDGRGKVAIQKGYELVCKKCGEVFKELP